jgi:hypothetical protein
MNFHEDFWVKWVCEHADGASRPPESGRSSLTKARISKLGIHVVSSAGPSSDLSDVTIIRRWLGVFPLLRELNFSGECSPFSDPSLNQQLSREIANLSLQLKQLHYHDRDAIS